MFSPYAQSSLTSLFRKALHFTVLLSFTDILPWNNCFLASSLQWNLTTDSDVFQLYSRPKPNISFFVPAVRGISSSHANCNVT